VEAKCEFCAKVYRLGPDKVRQAIAENKEGGVVREEPPPAS
jgi:hypothetical protein